MKIFAYAVLIAVFLANTVTVSAWAKPCLNDNVSSVSQILNDIKQDMGIMPCEEMQKNKNQNDNQHCDDVCFCMHISSSQTPIIGTNQQFQPPFTLRLSHNFSNEIIATLPYSPDKRPPKA